MRRILLLLVAVSAAGCAAPGKPMYYWNNYSSTLYDYKKEPSDEHLLKHKETLLKIIEDSRSNGTRVPPGVFCEYGYLLAREGRTGDAAAYFDLEAQTYPESAAFMEKLKARTGGTGKE